MNSTSAKVGWVAEPNGRGTANLLWSCFATILMCTWSAMHLDLPALKDTSWGIFIQRFFLMVWCLIAPEMVAIYALSDLRSVLRLRKSSKLRHPLTNRPWSLKQYYFLDMGGYVVQTTATKRLRFSASDLVTLIQEGTVDTPTMEDEEIDDRSKANWVTKTIALAQVIWFLAQLLGRAIQGLPVTTLELFTLAIILCAFITYACAWKKPFDVRRPVILQVRTTGKPTWPPSIAFSSNNIWYADENFHWPMILATLIFATPHLLGWNVSFVSEAEKWLWRSGSIGSAMLPLIMAVTNYFGRFEEPKLLLCMALYIPLRVGLFVEAFLGLRSVPMGVYQTVQWAQYFPSFG